VIAPCYVLAEPGSELGSPNLVSTVTSNESSQNRQGPEAFWNGDKEQTRGRRESQDSTEKSKSGSVFVLSNLTKKHKESARAQYRLNDGLECLFPQSQVLQSLVRNLNVLLQIEPSVRAISLPNGLDAEACFRAHVADGIQPVQFLNH
jgi:hypothetical protein